MKLGRKIFSYFGIFIFLVVFVFMAVNYFVIEKTLHKNAQEELKVMTESVNAAAESMLNMAIRNYLHGILEHYQDDLEDLYRKHQAGLLTEKQAKDTFQNHSLKHSVGKEGYIVALRPEESKIIIDIHPFARESDCSSNQGCQEWVAKKNGFNEYRWRNSNEKTERNKVGYFQYFEPWNWVVGVTAYKEEFRKLVDVEDLRPLIESFKVLDRGYFFVMDKDLKALIHPEVEGSEGAEIRNEDGIYIVQEMVNNLDGFYYYDWKNPSEIKLEKKFSYVKEIKNLDWYIVASGYVDDIKAPISKLMSISYVLIVLVAVGLGLLTVHFSRSLTRPLDSLINGLHEFYRERKVFQMDFRSVSEVESVGREIEILTSHLSNAEQDNKDLLTQLDGIVNSMPSMLVGVDDQEKVILWNEQAVEYTGFSREFAIQQPLSTVLNDYPEVLAIILQPLKSLQSFNETCQLTSEGQSPKYLDVTLYPLLAGLQAAVIRIDDITERVQIEETMLQSRKMEAVGQLAGGVAHDFNNLLAGIQNSTYLLERRVDVDKKAKGYLKIIKDASQSAADLTMKLLAFSRKNAKVSTQVHVHDAICETVAILRRSVDKSIEINLDIRAENDAVIGDLSQLQSTFMNLGINASHAMPSGGILTFRSSEVQLQATECDQDSLSVPPGRYLKIEVEDTGEGVPPEMFDKLFEPFFTTKEEGKGTGLGLWSAYGAIKQHSGDIQVVSDVGVGTVFTILLPLSESILSPLPNIQETIISGTGTVLMIEDEELLRTTTRGMLEVMGYSVLLANDGQEGLEMFRQHQADIDLVLLDMIMPIMGGRKCYEELRKLDADLPIVFVSGFSRKSDLEQVIADGGRFLRKPYHAVTLSKMISDAIKPKKS
jgi:PAS domain S-box-containing protein